ncbi:MAG: trypsin-like peptidase domain-containing protein [Polyangiaceae bacterium]
MGAWTTEHAKLRNILAGVYWDRADARRLVVDAGLDPLRMSWGNEPLLVWHSVLTEAVHQGKLDALIAKAAEENPGNTALAAAQNNALSRAILGEDLLARAWRAPTDPATLEKILGAVSTLRPISFLERGLSVSRSVCRVVLGNGTSGSGMLIGGGLVLTNNHVLPTRSVAASARIELNFQKTASGTDAPVDGGPLDPDEGFATSPGEELGGDDWTVVRMRRSDTARLESAFGHVPLVHRPAGSIKLKDEVIIIQHPLGGPKQIALSHNIVVYVDDSRIQYLTDTLEGSSGSPVFDLDWQVIALHHAGGMLREPGTKLAAFRNQGIHINRVIHGIEQARACAQI